MQILEELYYGNIRPDIKYYDEHSEFMELVKLRERSRENLMEHLSDKDKEAFENFTSAQSDIDSITRYEKFTYGFKLGALLMSEVFTGEL